VYKGLAIGTNSSGIFLYATNFRSHAAIVPSSVAQIKKRRRRIAQSGVADYECQRVAVPDHPGGSGGAWIRVAGGKRYIHRQRDLASRPVVERGNASGVGRVIGNPERTAWKECHSPRVFERRVSVKRRNPSVGNEICLNIAIPGRFGARARGVNAITHAAEIVKRNCLYFIRGLLGLRRCENSRRARIVFRYITEARSVEFHVSRGEPSRLD